MILDMFFKNQFVLILILNLFLLSPLSSLAETSASANTEDQETLTEEIVKAATALGVIGTVLRFGFGNKNNIALMIEMLDKELKIRGVKHPEKETDLLKKIQLLEQINTASRESEKEVKDYEAIPVQEIPTKKILAPSSI